MLTPRQALIATTAGPDNWWRLIQNDHTEMRPKGAIPLLTPLFNRGDAELTIERTITTLLSLAGASLILANTIASQTTYTAREAFLAAKNLAEDLGSYAPTPHSVVDNEQAWRAATKILQSGDSSTNLWLLVDLIRIANHITGEEP